MNNMHSFFCQIEPESYLVLRNSKEIDSNNRNHQDIDILCDNRWSLARRGNLQKKNWYGGVHYLLKTESGTELFDIRTVGDGYYDPKWERDMLERRIQSGCYYIPSETDYKYSLMYHVVVHKAVIADDYYEYLKEWGCTARQGIIAELEQFMRENGYKYVFPKDFGVKVNFDGVSQEMIDNNSKTLLRKTYEFFRR